MIQGAGYFVRLHVTTHDDVAVDRTIRWPVGFFFNSFSICDLGTSSPASVWGGRPSSRAAWQLGSRVTNEARDARSTQWPSPPGLGLVG